MDKPNSIQSNDKEKSSSYSSNGVGITASAQPIKLKAPLGTIRICRTIDIAPVAPEVVTPETLLDLPSVNQLIDNVHVFARKKYKPFFGWKAIPQYFSLVKNTTATLIHHLEHYKYSFYFSEKKDTRFPIAHGFEDLKESLMIFLSTWKEIIICTLCFRDSFYITKLFKKKGKHRQEFKLNTFQCSYKNRGHAHIILNINGDDDAPIKIAIDPATHKLAFGYKKQASRGTYQKNAQIILLTHAHLDHYAGITHVVEDYCARFLRRLITKFPITGKVLNRFLPSLKPVNQKVITPYGTKQIIPILHYINHHPATDGNTVGVEAFSFDPLQVMRKQHNNRYAKVMTIVPIIAKHWAGRIPFVDNHAAPAFGYLLKTNKKTIYFAGDTGFSYHLYQSIIDISVALKSPFIDVFFAPAGPDFDRKQMERNHQATIDIAIAHFYLQVFPFIKTILNQATSEKPISKQKLINLVGSKLECVFIHTGHYKMGNVHAEDPWFCMMDLIHTLHDPTGSYEFRAAKARIDGSRYIRKWLNTTEYQTNKEHVIELLKLFEKEIQSLNIEWTKEDNITVLLKLLLSQSEPRQQLIMNDNYHENLIQSLQNLIAKKQFDFQKLNLKNFSKWYFTRPMQRNTAQLHKCFKRTQL